MRRTQIKVVEQGDGWPMVLFLRVSDTFCMFNEVNVIQLWYLIFNTALNLSFKGKIHSFVSHTLFSV